MGRKIKILPGGIIPGGLTHKDECKCMWYERRPLIPPLLPDMTPKPKSPIRGPYYDENKKSSQDDILELE